MGICKLCERDRELQKSHIYPKSLIKHLRDKESNNKFVFLSDKEFKVPPQDGPKENLMCKDCEQKIGRFEKYFKDFFIERQEIRSRQKLVFHSVYEDLIEIKNYDYKRIRLFVLSIIWRLSVTSCNGFTITIAPSDKEKLRSMLFNEDPGDSTEFPFYTTLVRTGVGMDSYLAMNPIETDYIMENSVMIYIYGILFRVSKTSSNKNIQSELLLYPNKWLGKIRQLSKIPILNERFENILKK